jgi:hyperosmotically inducible periplasmic protein
MRNFRHLLSIGTVGLAIASVGLTGCSMLERKSNERTAGRMIDDRQLTASVKRELNAEPVYKFDDVAVKTFDGVVQLSGFVNTDEQKRRAGDIAQHTQGVDQVVNNITLKPTPTGRSGQRYEHEGHEEHEHQHSSDSSSK